MKELGPLDPDELKVLTFAFASELEGNTIATAEVSCAVLTGVDPDAAAMVVGSAVIDGTNVKQRVAGGLADVRYQLKAKVTDSLGLVHVIKAQVWVRN